MHWCWVLEFCLFLLTFDKQVDTERSKKNESGIKEMYTFNFVSKLVIFKYKN